MQKSVAASLLLAVSFTSNAASITVEGFGKDNEAAKRDAFRTAIENVCGTMVLSDREHFNENTTKDQVVTHSACNVKNYTVIEQRTGYIKLNVDVQPNNVAERLHATPNNTHVLNQPALEAQIETFKQERSSGDQLIKELFDDYPRLAYDLKTTTDITTNNHGNGYFLNVYYTINWNYNFLKSLIDALDTLKSEKATFINSIDNHDRPASRVTINYKKPQAWLPRQEVFYLNDLYRLDNIKNYFQDSLYLKIQARDGQGKYVIDRCSMLYNSTNDLYEAGKAYGRASDGSINQLDLFGTVNKTGSVWIPLTIDPSKIYDVSLSLVTKKQC